MQSYQVETLRRKLASNDFSEAVGGEENTSSRSDSAACVEFSLKDRFSVVAPINY